MVMTSIIKLGKAKASTSDALSAEGVYDDETWNAIAADYVIKNASPRDEYDDPVFNALVQGLPSHVGQTTLLEDDDFDGDAEFLATVQALDDRESAAVVAPPISNPRPPKWKFKVLKPPRPLNASSKTAKSLSSDAHPGEIPATVQVALRQPAPAVANTPSSVRLSPVQALSTTRLINPLPKRPLPKRQPPSSAVLLLAEDTSKPPPAKAFIGGAKGIVALRTCPVCRRAFHHKNEKSGIQRIRHFLLCSSPEGNNLSRDERIKAVNSTLAISATSSVALITDNMRQDAHPVKSTKVRPTLQTSSSPSGTDTTQHSEIRLLRNKPRPRAPQSHKLTNLKTKTVPPLPQASTWTPLQHMHDLIAALPPLKELPMGYPDIWPSYEAENQEWEGFIA